MQKLAKNPLSKPRYAYQSCAFKAATPSCCHRYRRLPQCHVAGLRRRYEMCEGWEQGGPYRGRSDGDYQEAAAVSRPPICVARGGGDGDGNGGAEERRRARGGEHERLRGGSAVTEADTESAAPAAEEAGGGGGGGRRRGSLGERGARIPLRLVLRCCSLSRAWAAALSSDAFIDHYLRLAKRRRGPKLCILPESAFADTVSAWSPETPTKAATTSSGKIAVATSGRRRLGKSCRCWAWAALEELRRR
uniref:Uncharacterized protein n=1 Tax=Oryza rufipogon TaxID=4529 RepID=A0A0E0PVB8_ORYRU